MGAGICPFLGWENGIYCTRTGIQPVGMGENLKNEIGFLFCAL